MCTGGAASLPCAACGPPTSSQYSTCWTRPGCGTGSAAAGASTPWSAAGPDAHRDLDLAVDAPGLDEVVRLLAGLGYLPQTDWLPVRLELAAPDDRWVDLHPVTFGPTATVVAAGLAAPFHYPAADLRVGWMDGRVVPVLSGRLQRQFPPGVPARPPTCTTWPSLDAPGGTRTESALLLEVPAAEPAVGGARAHHDSSAPLGVPAHLTVLYPFVPQPTWDARALLRVAAVAAAAAPVELSPGLHPLVRRRCGLGRPGRPGADPARSPRPGRSLPDARPTAAFRRRGAAPDDRRSRWRVGAGRCGRPGTATVAHPATAHAPQPLGRAATGPDSWMRLQRFPLGALGNPRQAATDGVPDCPQ